MNVSDEYNQLYSGREQWGLGGLKQGGWGMVDGGIIQKKSMIGLFQYYDFTVSHSARSDGYLATDFITKIIKIYCCHILFSSGCDFPKIPFSGLPLNHALIMQQQPLFLFAGDADCSEISLAVAV